jgi:uncharacterized protein (TIGR02147 family)
MKYSKVVLKDYLDFRTYIKDYIEHKNVQGEQLTNRSFASAIGISSSSWLTTILNGKKGITDKTVSAISDFFKHNDWDREYFRILVNFNQAKTVESRNDFFTQLKQLLLKKGYLAIRVLDNDQYEYYSKWYYSAVRSIIGMVSLGDEYERLARYVSPSITAAQAKKSIKLLLKLGLIEKQENGNYSITNSAISTGYNVKSLAVANFQRETMKLGIEAIDRYDSSTRDISSLSIGISESGFKKITGMIADFRKAIAEVANTDSDADRVYQVNFQVFPLSRVLNHDENEKND